MLNGFQARYISGGVTYMDYTPGSAVDAGDVIVLGDVTVIAHHAISANTLGAVAVMGGIYEANASEPVALGKKVYWDASGGAVTENTEDVFLGICTKAVGGSGGILEFLHIPASWV